MLKTLDKFHRSRPGLVVFALVELGMAYVFMSWAIDSGNWFDYLFVLLFAVGFLQNVMRLIGSFVHGASHRRRQHRH